MRINFDFTDLEAFLAVQDTGSFHLASEKLGLSQSAITRRIIKLETALGSKLFLRTTRDVKSTLAAKRLRPRAETILNDTRETARALRDESAAFAHQMARSLTIATIPTVIASVLAPALRSVSKAEQNVRFRLLDFAANEVAEAVAQGDADIGLCSVPAFEPTTRFEFLFDDPIVIALPHGHALTSKAILTWADLSDENLILPNRDTGNRMLIDDALARSGVPLSWKVEVGRTTTALDCVSNGLGMAPLPRSAIGSDVSSSVIYRPIHAPSIARPIGVVLKAGNVENALAQRVVDELRKTARSVASTK